MARRLSSQEAKAVVSLLDQGALDDDLRVIRNLFSKRIREKSSDRIDSQIFLFHIDDLVKVKRDPNGYLPKFFDGALVRIETVRDYGNRRTYTVRVEHLEHNVRHGPWYTDYDGTKQQYKSRFDLDETIYINSSQLVPIVDGEVEAEVQEIKDRYAQNQS